jgi:uncharacterized protein (TIGR02145 family)
MIAFYFFRNHKTIGMGLFLLALPFLASLSLAQVPELNSRPGSAFVLLLDVDGHTDSSGWWGGGRVVASPPGYSSNQITEIFNKVSEDFRPFDINVTTRQSVYDAVPVGNRQRVVFTPSDAWYNTGSGNTAGGVAFLGTFGGGEVACWVFTNRMGNAGNAAEAGSHELGHTLGLGHQSRYNSDCSKNTEYHSGTGSGETSWAPIMGVSYGKTITQWYHGPGNGSTCTSKTQNDLNIILNNGFSALPDDVANTLAGAEELLFSSPSQSRTRIITSQGDVDVFRLVLSTPGVYQFSGIPYAHNPTSRSGANLDVRMKIRNESGTLLADYDPVHMLTAEGSLFLGAGTYFVEIDGSGISGYVPTGGRGPQDFGSLGQYTFTVAGPLTCNASLLSLIPGERCGSGSLSLLANPSSGGTVNWYSTSGNLLSSGNTFQTPTLSSTSTYLAEVTTESCTSARMPVNAVVSVQPVVSAISGPATVQVGNSIQLSQTNTQGSWSSSHPEVAQISGSGLVTGMSGGSTTISYIATTGSCPPASASLNVTVTVPGPCGSGLVQDPDGNTYQTIQIGPQCWLKENLRTTRFADGSPIEAVPLSSDWANLNRPGWSHPEGNASLDATLGKLYNGRAVVSPRSVCPAGWHVPDQNEWNAAVSFLGGPTLAGGKMKSLETWNAPNTGATNSSGFSARAAGIRTQVGSFQGLGSSAGFWSVSTSDTSSISFRLLSDQANSSLVPVSGKLGQSVRCVQDLSTGGPPAIQFLYSGSICGSGSTFVSASPNKGFVAWYLTPTGGEPFWIGNFFQTPILTSSVTFYLEVVYGTQVSSQRTPVTILVKQAFQSGTLVSADQSLCTGGNPAPISFSVPPVSDDSLVYQWYFKDGIASCPSGSSTQGWTLISGATGSTYDPPTGLPADRTYAVFVTPISKRGEGGTGQPIGGSACGPPAWATGCRKVTVGLPPVVSAGPDQIWEAQSGNRTLTGTPAGGIWSGSGISTNGFFSTAQSPGIYNLIYTVSSPCSVSDTVQITLFNLAQVATPVIQPGTGTYTAPVQVSITCATALAQIYYTVSGNIPVIGTSFTRLYTGPFELRNNTTVRAMAVRSGSANSGIAVSFLTISDPTVVAAPVLSPLPGTFNQAVAITLTSSTPGATIYYTTNGNVPLLSPFPNSFTSIYTGPFTISSSRTIRALAVRAGLSNSPVTVGNYTITSPGTVAPVTLSPIPGVYSGPQLVSLNTSTPEATLYYTTNGNVPLLNPFPNSFTRIYSGPIPVNSSLTIRAMATRSGWQNSPVSVGIYTISPVRRSVQPEEGEPAWYYFEEEPEARVSPDPDVVPNPGKGVFRIRLPEDWEGSRVEIINPLGQKIREEVDLKTGAELNLSGLPAGLYRFHLIHSQGIKSIPVLLQ